MLRNFFLIHYKGLFFLLSVLTHICVCYVWCMCNPFIFRWLYRVKFIITIVFKFTIRVTTKDVYVRLNVNLKFLSFSKLGNWEIVVSYKSGVNTAIVGHISSFYEQIRNLTEVSGILIVKIHSLIKFREFHPRISIVN